ncbi:MAG: hypothetical protein M3332_00905 [Actinomycetota bacterium]|nr:hypothetical protein [Actinomycetota bacterium]
MKVVVGTVAFLLVAGVAYWIFDSSTTCGPGVDRIDDQCIGVTDGRVLLSEDLEGVLDKIHSENERIGKLDPTAVSVAYFIPLPKSPDDKLTELLLHELQGAHIAQLRANQPTAGRPLVRLLVANYGDQSSQWEQLTGRVLEKVEQPERLVAAVVTGRTVDNTIRAIDALRSGGFPVIASRLTGNKLTFLDERRVQGLARVAPTNNDQAESIALFLKQTASSALLVQDSNPNDSYLLSLGEAFKAKFEDQTHRLLEPTELYNSKLPGVESRMKRVLRNICVQRPDVVFFAGRTPALKAFVAALPERPCFDVPIRVVAGADAAEFPTEVRGSPDLRNALTTKSANAEVSVIYTSQAHPESWSGSPGSFAPDSMYYLGPDCEGNRCYENLFPGEQTDDGAAIIGHDAVTVATSAIRSEQINDTPGLIIQEFNSMRGDGAVPGASGWISLDENGNTVNKAVAILQVKPDGTVQWLALNSREGLPCNPNDAIRPC